MRIEHSMSWEKRHLMGDIENPNVENVINMWQRKSASQNHQKAMLSSMQNEDVSWCEFSSTQGNCGSQKAQIIFAKKDEFWMVRTKSYFLVFFNIPFTGQKSL